jgi:hypothetical protein
VLIAPAWKTFDIEPVIDRPTIIFHADKDNLVSLKDSQKLAENPLVTLHVVDDDHRVNKHIKDIIAVVEQRAKEIGKETPEPLRLKKYNVTLSPSGYMYLQEGKGGILTNTKDEVFIDTVNKTMHKIYKPYIPGPRAAKPKKKKYQKTGVLVEDAQLATPPVTREVEKNPIEIWGIKTTVVPKDEK